MNDIIEYKSQPPATANEVIAQVGAIQSIMKQVMVKDVHFGIIPGTKKNTLYKPGSDMLLTAFHIAIDPEIEDLSTMTEIRYRIRCKGVHMGTGNLIGVGLGECSSNEEKYKWVKATEKQFQTTSPDRKRIKYGEKWNQQARMKEAYEIKQVLAEPSDIANTILKMAKKRAQIDMTLTALAASDVFERPDGAPPATRPAPQQQSKPQAQTQRSAPNVPDFEESTVSDDDTGELNLGVVRTKMSKTGLRDIDLWAALEVASWGEVTGEKLNQAMQWIEENQP